MMSRRTRVAALQRRLIRFQGGLLVNLPRRVLLTYRYLGPREVAWRAVTFPLRLTPLRARLGFRTPFENENRRAALTYRRDPRPVCIVIPTYGRPEILEETLRGIRDTTDPGTVRVVVADDASPPEHQARLRELKGIELVLGEENLGFAGNANRGLERVRPGEDVVLLNNDVVAREGWLERLQYHAHSEDQIGMVSPKLLYPDGRIQSAGSFRNPDQPEWFDHRFRFKPADFGPADVPVPVLAATGACLYVTAEALAAIGPLDAAYGMAFEDMDWCLRAWQAGYEVHYQPRAWLTHHESVTRGTVQGPRELASQERFWAQWGDVLNRREVRTEGGGLRVIYVTEDTGVGGGHRDIFEHLNRLAARGHEAELYTLGGEPDWFELDVPVRSFADYGELSRALSGQDAIKVATWWGTAGAVWRGSVLRGRPAFFVQDIETSYYPDDPLVRDRVLASYRQEFAYMTISGWNRDRLAELGLSAALVPPGIDLETFHPTGEPREEGVVLCLGRSLPLKNLDLTLAAWHALGPEKPELWMFGIEPELGPRNGARYFERPSDAEVNALFSRATVFVQTSIHEGFCLPALESMATGGAVVCTDMHGNRDFCRDGENCLMVEAEVDAVAAGLRRALGDPELRARLGEAGKRTAAEYTWEKRIDELEGFLEGVAGEGRRAATGRVA